MTEQSYIQLIRGTYPSALKLAEIMVKNHHTAEDIVGDTLLHMWEKREIIVEDSLSGLLIHMVRNRCFDYLRRKAARMRKVVLYLDVPDTYPAPYDEEIEKRETEMRIRAVDDLSSKILTPQQKSVFDMYFRQGLKRQITSDVLNIKRQTVSTHLKDALKRFRTHLIDPVYGTPVSKHKSRNEVSVDA
jgi:RNA polymerase sigma factor (sigma-70 family)